MAKSDNLRKAKEAKNDEFYTQLSDIENELKHYKDHFKGKTVFLNCDDPNMGDGSNFFEYFTQCFDHLGLKKLISTSFNDKKPTYKWVVDRQLDLNNDGKINKDDAIKTRLKENGDFRSDECIELLKEADIVVTNPPFSLFRDYLEQLVDYGKKFLFIGPVLNITNRDTFPYIVSGDIWFGNTYPKGFIQPDGSLKKFGNIGWFTNLTHKKQEEEFILYKNYNTEDHPTYDNYDAIHVDKATNMPIDYDGLMGVPVTFLTKHNKHQFDIVGLFCDKRVDSSAFIQGVPTYVDEGHKNHVGPVLNGKAKFNRVIIKKK